MEDMDPVEPVQDMTSSDIHLLVKDNGPNATHREVKQADRTYALREHS